MITFHLKKGIKFHDGSDFNADAVAYNFTWLKETKRLQYGEKVKSIDIVDPYTVRLRLTEYNNMLIHGLGWVFMWSKVALTTKTPDYLRETPWAQGRSGSSNGGVTTTSNGKGTRITGRRAGPISTASRLGTYRILSPHRR